MISTLVVIGCVVTLDQASKALVASRFPEGAGSRLKIVGIRLRHIVNRRRSWTSSVHIRVLIALWLFLVSTGFTMIHFLDMPWLHFALGMSIGGATGNLIDALRQHGITDFIDLRVWPVFNIADVAIVVGALLAAWNVFSLR